ncbi:DNA recombination protein RmuC [Halocynthiibacter namhaensis]|uniref:DNA recombination protein RmuC n=1 Tax=Halocynthiibacter namhaensis TaxID=1290553 RepID=UPI000579645A|nr:DNA recombination protein RmuC [Halocynthiibacter namhaensis]
MITIGDNTYSISDPAVFGTVLLLLVVILLFIMLKRAGRSGEMAEQLTRQLMQMNEDVRTLGSNQQHLGGQLQSVSDVQANAQHMLNQKLDTRIADMQQYMADRLSENALKSANSMSEMQERMKETLHGSSKQTTASLTQLQERLATIDKAQTNIEKLSGDVLGLQDILSNKQTRGNFGEIQLNDIVTRALPSDAYTFQATLSNGKRADCLVHLPNPPGPIVIDSKFPLEAYEALVNAAGDKEATQRALSALKSAVRVHIKAISEKYLIEGETADGALMFLPSEAVYAELHARLPDVVREGFSARVWIVSPTTCMATLNTMRAVLKDARMREHAGRIRSELQALSKDVGRLGDRVVNLDRHFSLAQKDISEIKTSSEKAQKRAVRLDNFDFEEIAPEAEQTVVPLTQG